MKGFLKLAGIASLVASMARGLPPENSAEMR